MLETHNGLPILRSQKTLHLHITIRLHGSLPSGNLDITVAWSDLKKYESINDIWIQTGKRTRG